MNLVLPFSRGKSVPLDWIAGTFYKVGNVVSYNGIFWRCVTQNQDVIFDDTKWTKIIAIQKKVEMLTVAEQLSYVLPDVPNPLFPVVVIYNSLDISFTIVGSVFTITEYVAGDIEANEEMKIYYYV